MTEMKEKTNNQAQAPRGNQPVQGKTNSHEKQPNNQKKQSTEIPQKALGSNKPVPQSALMDPKAADAAIKNVLNPTLSAAAREKLAKSEAVSSMCNVIEKDPKLTTDEKLDRLRKVNEIEQENKEQAHRIVTESTWQDGLIAFGLLALGVGLTYLFGIRPTKVAKNLS